MNADDEVVLLDRHLTLEDYLINFGVIECLKIDKLMIQHHFGFKEAIQYLMLKNGADAASVSGLLVKIGDETGIQFEELVSCVKQVQLRQMTR